MLSLGHQLPSVHKRFTAIIRILPIRHHLLSRSAIDMSTRRTTRATNKAAAAAAFVVHSSSLAKLTDQHLQPLAVTGGQTAAGAAVAAAAATFKSAPGDSCTAKLLVRAASAKAADTAAGEDLAADSSCLVAEEPQVKKSRRRNSSKQPSTPRSNSSKSQQPVSGSKRAKLSDCDGALLASAAAAVAVAVADAAAALNSSAGAAVAAMASSRAHSKRGRRCNTGTPVAPAAAGALVEEAAQAPVARSGRKVPAAAAVDAVDVAIRSVAGSAVTAALAADGGGGDKGGAAAVAPVSGIQLLDLGKLVVGQVVKRPSATVKTPYVADVLLPDGSMVLAHTPALDCAGMIVPGARVHMTANAVKREGQQATKTSHAVQIAEEVREDGSTASVGAHPFLAEKLADAAVQQHLLPLPPHLQGYTSVTKQQKAGNGRFDFALCYEDGSRLLLEVKNVVGADYPSGQVPGARSKVGVYTSTAVPYTRTAIFPHGAVKKGIGVVSDRAIKHLHELTLLQQAGRDDEGRPIRCGVLFIVNRSDCSAFRPCHEACMTFARMVQRAQQAGVLVLAHDVCWQGGKAVWGKPLPVVYDAGVRAADVDEQQLQAVLEFNATDPRTHWKKQKSKPTGKA